MAPTSLLASLTPIITNHVCLHDPEYVPIDPLLPTTALDSSASSDLDLPFAFRKGKQSFTMHPISNFVSYDRLSPLSRQFVMSISFVSIPKSY